MGIAFVQRFIFLVPLAGGELDIWSVIHTTAPISLTEALKALDEIKFT